MEEKSSAAVESLTLEKWGFTLHELYRLSLGFYKQNAGKAIHLSYEDNLKLAAFKQQALLGSFEVNASKLPTLGIFDVIGKDRRIHWQALGDISREQAMEGFIDLLDKMCKEFRPYIDAVRQNRDEELRQELKRMELEKLEKEKTEREQLEALEESYKEEIQRRQLQDALNKQTYQQFKNYAEKQFPGNPEQQAVLIHQLQQEHYHQYMQQLHMQNQSYNMGINIQQQQITATVNNNRELSAEDYNTTKTACSNELNSKTLENGLGYTENDKLVNALVAEDQQHIEVAEHQQAATAEDDDDDYVIIKPAKIWTRPDIEEFKAEVSAGDGDGRITIGHGDTVTVRVPTNANGKCIFWEFATDNYDIGFGIYFEWSKPVTNEVTVHVTDSDDDEDFTDEDYLSTNDDLECGVAGTTDGILNTSCAASKPPISIIVPIYRRECFNEVYVGSHAYPGEGVYLLKFDNSFSIWRSKTLYYRVYYER